MDRKLAIRDCQAVVAIAAGVAGGTGDAACVVGASIQTLYSQKETCSSSTSMSAKCHKQTSARGCRCCYPFFPTDTLKSAIKRDRLDDTAVGSTNPGGKYVHFGRTNAGGKYVYRGVDTKFHTNPGLKYVYPGYSAWRPGR